MQVLIEAKIPASLERTINPPTPMAASILELVKTPIVHVTEKKDPEYRWVVFGWDLVCLPTRKTQSLCCLVR